MNNNEDWLKKIKEQVDNYEAPVSDDLWSRIESDLPKKSPVILYIKRTAAAIASIAAVAAIVFAVRFANISNPQNNLISSAKTDITEEIKAQTANNGYIATQAVKESIALNKTRNTTSRKSQTHSTTAAKAEAAKTIAETHSIAAENDSKNEQKAYNDNNNRFKAIKEFKESTKSASTDYRRKTIIPTIINNDKKWSIAMAVNNGIGNRNKSANGFAPISNGYAVNKFTTRTDKKMGHFNYVYSSVVAKNIEKEAKTEIEYDIPLTYAAMFRYHFNRHWAIDAGVQFSHLGASWNSGSNHSYYSSTQKLIFIGIPVGASFTFVDTRFFSMYATAGGSVDKCAAGSIKSFAQSGRKKANTGKRDLPEHPWQFSINAGLGMQFNATKHIGIFAEPKATRFFDTAKELSLRKHHTEFQLLVGLRLTY